MAVCTLKLQIKKEKWEKSLPVTWLEPTTSVITSAAKRGQKACHWKVSFTSIYQTVREGLSYLETVFAKFVPVGKGPVFDGFHGNKPNHLIYG